MLRSKTYIIAHHPLHFVVIHEVACPVEYQTKLSAQVVLFEDFFAWHVIHHLELHEECIQELGITTKEGLPSGRALAYHAPVLRVRDLDGQ